MLKSIDRLTVCVSTGTTLTVVESLCGALDKSLGFLCLVMVIDFITGLLCGASEHCLSSDICTKGLFKKFFIMIYVVIGYQLDVLLGVDYIRTAICFTYGTGEVISIIENGVRLGVPVPEPIEKALQLLNGGEDNENE